MAFVEKKYQEFKSIEDAKASGGKYIGILNENHKIIGVLDISLIPEPKKMY